MVTRKKQIEAEVEIESLLDLLNEHVEGMRTLFAKTLNLYVSPGADLSSPREKADRLRQFVEESLG